MSGSGLGLERPEASRLAADRSMLGLGGNLSGGGFDPSTCTARLVWAAPGNEASNRDQMGECAILCPRIW
jgi:hypothetical protein